MDVVSVVTPDGPWRTPLDGCGHGGDPGKGWDCGWTWSWWSPQRGPGGRPWMDVVMVVTQGRAQEGTVDGRGHDGHLGKDPAGRPQMDVVMVVTQERAR